MKIAFYTLGCKVNQYETQALAQLAFQRGHTPTPWEEPADIYVINTCTVTAMSDQKSRQTIRRIKKLAPQALIAVCGCYAQTHAQEMAQLGVDVVGGTGDRSQFVALLEQAWEGKQPITQVDNPLARTTFEPLPPGGLEGRTRAMLKIEDGCQYFCSYCIIPYARGKVRSLPKELCLSQCLELVQQGYQEIVLTGIEISSWGLDLPGTEGLIDLVEAICHQVPPHVRIRLGSLEPRTISPSFCQRAVALPNLCPHFHLSLQSGSDAVLRRMNRGYDSGRYLESVSLLRASFVRPAITTDLIVGFPGETQEEFQESLHFMEQCAFSSLHIFPYSQRPGTPAARMEGQISRQVKVQRANQASALAQTLESAYLDLWIGEEVSVLMEQERDGLWQGHTPHYTSVAIPSTISLHNQLCSVQVTGRQGQLLLGQGRFSTC